MSENKNIPVEIFISEATAKQLIERLNIEQQHYILKSKYDELEEENEKLKSELEKVKESVDIFCKHYKSASDFYNKPKPK